MVLVWKAALFSGPKKMENGDTSMIMKKKKRLSSTKESRFSKSLSKRAKMVLSFFSVYHHNFQH